jgi:mannose-6-phosphate isomerase-like protein (cupin superfamily)
MRIVHLRHPTPIPVPGGKIIEEHAGRVACATDSVSVAHMVAPPGWGEPAQRPEFDEVTVVVRGRLEVRSDEATIVVGAGETVLVPRGVEVRYANPFPEACEYWAVCTPAFTVERAGRRD